MDIEGFLARAAARPWCWGEHDCTLFAADWIVERRGIDPARGWRRTYSTALGCERALQRAGGLERVVAEAMAWTGFRETNAVREGDVGLVLRCGADLQLRPTGAIVTTGEWVSLTAAGLFRADAPLVTAWRV